jgi:hypothetical protein
MKPYQSLEDRLLLLQHTADKHDSVSIKKILEILSGKGRLLILMLLALPFCLPIPLPGMSIPFGLLIAFFGIRMAFGQGIWLPQKILSKKVKTSHVKKIAHKTLKLVRKMQAWTHPRLQWMCVHPIMKVINGIVICLVGLALAIPIPIPFSNITAAWSIFIICFGIIEDDGVFTLIGYLMFLITIVIYTIIGTSISAMV